MKMNLRNIKSALFISLLWVFTSMQIVFADAVLSNEGSYISVPEQHDLISSPTNNYLLNCLAIILPIAICWWIAFNIIKQIKGDSNDSGN
jgi:hypothetical protein